MLARETNRRLGILRPIADETSQLLHAVAEREGARLHLVTGQRRYQPEPQLFSPHLIVPAI